MDQESKLLLEQGIWPVPWARRVQKIIKKMSPEELAEFPDIVRVEEAHRLIFTATYVLMEGQRSLAEIISACGRRLRGMRLGLATGHDLWQGTAKAFENAVKAAVKAANGGEDTCNVFDDENVPPEALLGIMLWTEWVHSDIQHARDLQDARVLHEELLKVIARWKDKKFVARVMKRLDEMGVTDFNPEDFRLRLVSQLANFYLNHPAARHEGTKGTALLDKIIEMEREDYGAAYLLADIKIQMGKPTEAVNIVKPALEDAVSKKFQYNAARLHLMMAKAVIAGGLGPRYTNAQVVPILKDARTALKGCKFYLPKGKYEMYNASLSGLERQVGVNGDGANEERASSSRRAEEVEPTYLNQWAVSCSNCRAELAEMPKCAGCGVARYCTRRCQIEAWPDHKAQCRKVQANKKKEEEAKQKNMIDEKGRRIV